MPPCVFIAYKTRTFPRQPLKSGASKITLFFASGRMINNAQMRRPFKKTALASILFAGAFLAVAATAEAQQAKKIPRIGVLRQSGAHVLWTQVEAFRQGLRERGYFEGQNISIEYRYAGGEIARLPSLADELVRMKVDVIVVSSTPAVFAT